MQTLGIRPAGGFVEASPLAGTDVVELVANSRTKRRLVPRLVVHFENLRACDRGAALVQKKPDHAMLCQSILDREGLICFVRTSTTTRESRFPLRVRPEPFTCGSIMLVTHSRRRGASTRMPFATIELECLVVRLIAGFTLNAARGDGEACDQRGEDSSPQLQSDHAPLSLPCRPCQINFSPATTSIAPPTQQIMPTRGYPRTASRFIASGMPNIGASGDTTR